MRGSGGLLDWGEFFPWSIGFVSVLIGGATLVLGQLFSYLTAGCCANRARESASGLQLSLHGLARTASAGQRY